MFSRVGIFDNCYDNLKASRKKVSPRTTRKSRFLVRDLGQINLKVRGSSRTRYANVIGERTICTINQTL